ncbi:MAG: transglutaminase family protein [Planctomycetaceae bacterium]|nr:transglutaminase family protein [Planctomycetaceae bacterium]
MKYRIDHTTTYVYSTPVALSHNQVHLVPRNSERQECHVSRQHIHPTPSVVRSGQDFFGNNAGFFMIEHPHRELTVISQSVVEVAKPTWPESASTPAWEAVRDALRRPLDETTLDARLYVFESPLVKMSKEVREYAAPSFRPERPLVEAVAELTTRIFREFKYDPAATAISTPTLDVLRLRRGVCQDFAHLQIACLRSLGLAARYVSGYLVTDPPAGQPKLVGADASHAWLAVWCPGSGWVDFDPTNGCLPSDRHITIAWGRDYSDVSPVKGVVLGGGMHTLRIAVDVSPVNGS